MDTRTPSAAEGLGLLQAICPSDIETTGGLSCKTCPDFTPFKGRAGPFTLRKLVYGVFTKPNAQEAFAGFSGCAPPPAAGGSLLLERSQTGWRMLQFEPGRYNWQCLRYPLKERRHILICRDSWSWQGFEETEIFSLDLAAPEDSRLQSVLHVVSDNAGSCPEVYKRIEMRQTELRDLNFDAMRDLVLFMAAGKAPVPVDRRKKCEGLSPPPMNVYRLDFLFNGKVFLTAPWSVETKKLLEEF